VSFTWDPLHFDHAMVAIPLNVDAPPCRHCKHWKPIRKVGRVNDEAVLCHARQMMPDFSCFESKPEA